MNLQKFTYTRDVAIMINTTGLPTHAFVCVREKQGGREKENQRDGARRNPVATISSADAAASVGRTLLFRGKVKHTCFYHVYIDNLYNCSSFRSDDYR